MVLEEVESTSDSLLVDDNPLSPHLHQGCLGKDEGRDLVIAEAVVPDGERPVEAGQPVPADLRFLWVAVCRCGMELETDLGRRAPPGRQLHLDPRLGESGRCSIEEVEGRRGGELKFRRFGPAQPRLEIRVYPLSASEFGQQHLAGFVEPPRQTPIVIPDSKGVDDEALVAA